MSKLPKTSIENLVLGACLFVILIVFPVTLWFWNTHEQALQRAKTAENNTLSAIYPQQAELPINAGPPPLPPGTRAANIISTTVNGKNYEFDSQSSHIKIVDFWATWCGPCHMSIPALEALDSSLRSSGVEIIGVSEDMDTANLVRPFAQQMGIQYTVLVNPAKNSLAAEIYNANLLPSIYVIDGKGIIRWSFSGYWPDEEQYIRQVIDDIQNGRPVS